jgi:hypothetical protein
MVDLLEIDRRDRPRPARTLVRASGGRHGNGPMRGLARGDSTSFIGP